MTMKRWVFTTLAGLSTLLCIGFAFLGVRSFWIDDGIGRETWEPSTGTLGQANVESMSGGLVVVLSDHFYRDPELVRHLDVRQRDRQGWGYGSRPVPKPQERWRWLRLRVHQDNAGMAYSTTVFEIPHWLTIVVTGILPCVALIRTRRQRRRRRLGLCLACGYDLRASRNRCPECGILFDQEARLDRPAVAR